MALTGNTGTITFGTSGFTLAWTKIGEWQATRAKLETSTLATTVFKTFMADDLADPGEIEVEALFDATKALGSIGAAAETITITYPKSAGTAAKLAGTGFITMVSTPELVNGSVSKQKLKVAFNGGTGPAFTAQV